MSSIQRGDVRAVKSDGTVVNFEDGKGTTLLSSSTYFFIVSAMDAPTEGVSIKWDATFIGVFTIETTNFPPTRGGGSSSVADVSDFDLTVGNWIRQDPSTAFISVTSTDGTTGNATITNATVSVGGTTAGGATYDIGNLGARRTRIKCVVTTGGLVRVASHGKST